MCAAPYHSAHAAVTATNRDEPLQISCGAVLEFGDCYTGLVTRQQLTLRNTADRAMVVHLASDVPTEVHYEVRANRARTIGDGAAVGESPGDGFNSSGSGDPTEPQGTADATLGRANSANASRAASPTPHDSGGDSSSSGGGGGDLPATRGERVQEVTVAAGGTVVLDVCYRPARPSVAEAADKVGRLTRRRFRLLLAYSAGNVATRVRRTVQGAARVAYM